jgi:DNA-directed RNA polymerase subunit RPC12/RpoP
MNWKRVPDSETPEKTVVNVPDEMVEREIRSLSYIQCPTCGHKQWERLIKYKNNRIECDVCGAEGLA